MPRPRPAKLEDFRETAGVPPASPDGSAFYTANNGAG